MQTLRKLATEIKQIPGLKIRVGRKNVEFDHEDPQQVQTVEQMLKSHQFIPGRKGRKLFLTTIPVHGNTTHDSKVPPFLNLLRAKRAVD